MKALRIIGGIVIILVAIFLIGGMLLPKSYSIHRSTTIKASDSVVYMNVANLNNFLKWNPWTKMEPSAKVNISGSVAEPGHLWTWEGKETGTGAMELKHARPYSLVDFELRFTAPFESTAMTSFTLDKTVDGTNVTWSMSGDSNTNMERWMSLFMDKMMDKDFTGGLKSLKELSENK